MSKSQVAILRTSPATVFSDYHRLMNLARYQDVLPKDVETALKVNISWHFFFPGCSTTPWQLDGVIRAMAADGYRKDLSTPATTAPWSSTRISANARTSTSTSSRRMA